MRARLGFGVWVALSILCFAAPRTVLAQGGAGAVPPVDDSGGHPFGIRGRVAMMPADGALPIQGVECAPPDSVTVVDAAGTAVPGAVHEAATSLMSGGCIYAWVPSMPLALGFYEVTIVHPWSEGLTARERFEVVAPFVGLPPITTEPSANLLTRPLSVACCATRMRTPGACFTEQVENIVHLEPGLSSSAGSAQLNQFLFRIRPAEESGSSATDVPWVPLEQVTRAIFFDQQDEYCVRIGALSIATMTEQDYEAPACAPAVAQPIGAVRVLPEPGVLAMDGCAVPPSGFEEAWCEANRSARDGSEDEREHYAFVCTGGRRPASWDEGLEPGGGAAGVSGLLGAGGAPVRFDPGPPPSSPSSGSSSGCSVSATSSARLSLAWLVPALLLIARRPLGDRAGTKAGAAPCTRHTPRARPWPECPTKRPKSVRE